MVDPSASSLHSTSTTMVLLIAIFAIFFSKNALVIQMLEESHVNKGRIG